MAQNFFPFTQKKRVLLLTISFGGYKLFMGLGVEGHHVISFLGFYILTKNLSNCGCGKTLWHFLTSMWHFIIYLIKHDQR